MRLLHKETEKNLSCIYSHWIHNIVNKGLADEYIIVENPDIVNLVLVDSKGKIVSEKIVERKTAETKNNESPELYKIEEIDVNLQIQKDINNSIPTKRKFRNRMFYSLSFIFLYPLFSRKVRTALKIYIDTNINVITTIGTVVLIILTFITVYLMTRK